MEIFGSNTEDIRITAYKQKAMIVEKIKEGNIDGARALARGTTFVFRELPGLRRLNAVIHVLDGYEKKINGSVDWYAVLGVKLTDDIETIRKRYRKLFLDMTMDDDDSLDITYKANKILTDSWKFLCTEKGKELYDKRRRYQLRFKHRQLRSLNFAPVVSQPAPKSNLIDEQLVRLILGIGGGERKREEPPSTNVPQVKQRRRIRRQNPPVALVMRNIAPEGCPEVLKAFTKEELKNLDNTPKEVAVNGVVGSMVNVASDDDEAMKNRGMESNNDTHV